MYEWGIGDVHRIGVKEVDSRGGERVRSGSLGFRGKGKLLPENQTKWDITWPIQG